MSYPAKKEFTKDVMILAKSAKRGLNQANKLRVEFSMNSEQVGKLLAELTALKDSPRGVKLDIHLTPKTYEGREFDSGIAFVREIQEFGAARGGVAKSFPTTPTKGFLTADDVKAKASTTASKSFG